jgi:N-hydroxyarylamine O-acetyltransferase
VLRALHTTHLLTVPFENLDIHLGRPIVLDQAALYAKIVARRRGGFCYELNGLFAALLRALGFSVTLLSARVSRPDGDFGPEFDHLTLLVEHDERWLADVGFGDSFREPLRLDAAGVQAHHGRAYSLTHDADQWTVHWPDSDGHWQARYRFTLQPRHLNDFAGMCHVQQTSPDSSFTQRRICTRTTPDGRVTLSDLRLIITAGDERQERQLRDEAEYRSMLREHFGIALAEI